MIAPSFYFYRPVAAGRQVAGHFYSNIRPKEGQTIEVWGVVTAALTLFRN